MISTYRAMHIVLGVLSYKICIGVVTSTHVFIQFTITTYEFTIHISPSATSYDGFYVYGTCHVLRTGLFQLVHTLEHS